MSSIQGLVNELQSIRNELKTLRTRGVILRKKCKGIENDIDQYLTGKNQPGIKYKGLAIIRETKTSNKLKKKSDQTSDLIKLAEEYGIKDTGRFIDDINNTRKGSPEERTKLKFKKYKKKDME